MNQDKSITSLQRLLNDMKQILAKEDEKQTYHSLEIDLLKQKTLEIYDILLHLKTPHQQDKNTSLANDRLMVNEPAPLEETTSSPSEPDEHAINENKPEEETPTEELPKSTVLPKTNPPQQKKEKTSEKTTLDLFSDPPAASIGESLVETKDHALGERLQKAHITDLREAIGINDKFIFINQLFKGDMERYNSILDELNGFLNLKGAKTYLSELAIQHQWDEEGPAYQKLLEMLERKFS